MALLAITLTYSFPTNQFTVNVPQQVNMNQQEALLNHLLTFVSENKKQLFLEKIEYRTDYLTVVLENIFQPHNASAVLRSCDVFGVQNVHIIENDNEYTVNPAVALGASKWLNLNRYNTNQNNTLSCINKLKEEGYTIYAATPHTNDCLIEDMPLDNKAAILFGTEQEGLSEIAMQHVDGHVKIPMYGFTESLNISVSAAICLYELTKRLKTSNHGWQLTQERKTAQLIKWCKQVIKAGDAIEQEFLAKI